MSADTRHFVVAVYTKKGTPVPLWLEHDTHNAANDHGHVVKSGAAAFVRVYAATPTGTPGDFERGAFLQVLESNGGYLGDQLDALVKHWYED